uniref:DUF4283 domain-containing protein n=1 Tax=Tanacetum cinerariifolium TaxID=118510 RepID=A0A6L2MDV3_TANCI|nr:hypothetical protein [Tanacetum cinerariifolium]
MAKESRAYSSQPKKGNEGFVKSSFASVLKSGNHVPIMAHDSARAIVLDDSCIMEKDFSCSLMGKVKDINVLSNLYLTFTNEGFENFKLTYLGGFWVLIDSESKSLKEKITNHVGVASWFHELLPGSNSFVSDDRIVWVSVEGLPIKTLTRNTFAKIISSWGELIDVEDHVNVSLSYKKLCVKTRNNVIINDKGKKSDNGFAKELEVDHVSVTKDPFGIYKLLNKKNDKEYTKGEDPTFPLGFTPDDADKNALNNEKSTHQPNDNLHSSNHYKKKWI